MTAVQTTKYFQHPANWAGFVLIGQDVKLTHRVAMMGQALREIISTPDRCRDALRVTLHLVSWIHRILRLRGRMEGLC